MPRRIAVLSLLFLASLVAVAGQLDHRGWSEGTVALNAARVLEPIPDQAPLDLPRDLAKKIKGPTLLVYFSPTCPHCQHAQPELNALSKRLDGTLTVIGIASGAASATAMGHYAETYEVPYDLVHDNDRAIAQALGIRSTPSALLVTRHKREITVVDGWYPYQIGGDVLVEMRVAEDPWSAFRPGEYHGVTTCAFCHVQEADSWVLTHHSIAWHTLTEIGRDTDPECTGCHVTGNGEPTGWDGDPESRLVDVGCEACHGPGGPHDGTPTVPSTTCEGCHDDKHSIAFSYDKGLPLIDHFRGVHLSNEAYREARVELVDGSAPRRLLAFAEGSYVGAAACHRCHEAEYDHWVGTPHAQAMATLDGDAAKAHAEAPATEVGCVRCHATQTVSGPPPHDLSAYRVEEAVGCESCHGPGDAHVAAGGGTDNIEGLGESCPVCVLEALCTSCHTPEWDPEWDLDTRLPAVGHGTSE